MPMLAHANLTWNTKIDDSQNASDVLGGIAKFSVKNRVLFDPGSILMSSSSGLLAALDVISTATFNKPLNTWPLPHSVALANAYLVHMTGCQPWVFQKILDIINLRAWKLDVTKRGALNVVELAKKASKIQIDIQIHQADFETGRKHRHQTPIEQGTSITTCCRVDNLEEGSYKEWPANFSRDTEQITEVYAHAAEIFLHTTTSGAYPDVSSIRDAVSKTISTIQRLRHPHLLKNMSWPICVAASMAGPEHDLFFSSIEEGARGDGDYSFKLTRALAIAKECQRLRKTNTPATSAQDRCVYDWFDATRSLSQEWYLL